MNTQTIKTDQLENQFESTYKLLVRSAEKSRNIFEVLMYPLLLLGPIVAVAQFAQQPIDLPAAGLDRPRCLVCDKQTAVGRDEATAVVRRPAVKG